MARFQNFDEVYSALFVDFDNMYTRLLEQDPTLARTFATNPQRWLRWLEGHALRMMYGDGVRRRILKRCCYLNPIKYHEFRPFFIRSAFMVVDCPPLTNYGKTSADIHLVMDCMDILSHQTRFDEVIILSGDADFTPLLLRIQEHARRSLVLSVGYTSPAYAAACSWRIREDWFMAQALEEPREDGESESPAPRPAEREERRDSGEAPGRDKAVNLTLPVYKRIRLVESIKQLVSESSVPVPLPSVAQVLQREQEATTDWFGVGTLRDLLELLDLAPIAFTAIVEGYVFDPSRHERPVGDGLRDEFRSSNPELYELALKVHRLTDVPLLSPAQYGTLFAMLADEINQHGFSRTGTVRCIEEQCEDEDLHLNANQIAFVVEAVIRGGVNLSGAGKHGQLDAQRLRRAFAKSADDLCAVSQMTLSREERALLSRWLQPKEAG